MLTKQMYRASEGSASEDQKMEEVKEVEEMKDGWSLVAELKQVFSLDSARKILKMNASNVHKQCAELAPTHASGTNPGLNGYPEKSANPLYSSIRLLLS